MIFLRKCYVRCMSSYTYGDYVCFKNMIDTTNEHHNHYILNHIPELYITSPLKLMDDIFESFSSPSVDKMQKMDEITCINYGSVIKSQCM